MLRFSIIKIKTMSQNENKRNLRLGAFVLGSVVIFLATVFYLGSQNNYFNKTFTVSAVFKNVEGLKPGDNVWLSGVKIGTIKNVQIISQGEVMVELSLKDKQNEFIKKDATAFIGSDGLIGNKIVIIRPGKSTQTIENGDTINSFSPTDTQELFDLAKEVGSSTRSITADLKVITERLKKGEGILGELLQEGQFSADLRSTLGSLRSAGENTNRITAELQNTVSSINDGEGMINKLLTDTTYVNSFEQALENVVNVSEDTKRMSEDLKAVIGKINDPDNAIGVLLADTAFANTLKTTLDNTEAATDKLDENMLALRENFLFRRYFRKKEKEEKKKNK